MGVGVVVGVGVGGNGLGLLGGVNVGASVGVGVRVRVGVGMGVAVALTSFSVGSSKMTVGVLPTARLDEAVRVAVGRRRGVAVAVWVKPGGRPSPVAQAATIPHIRPSPTSRVILPIFSLPESATVMCLRLPTHLKQVAEPRQQMIAIRAKVSTLYTI